MLKAAEHIKCRYYLSDQVGSSFAGWPGHNHNSPRAIAREREGENIRRAARHEKRGREWIVYLYQPIFSFHSACAAHTLTRASPAG